MIPKCILVFADGHTEERPDPAGGLYLIDHCKCCGSPRYFKSEYAHDLATKDERNPRGTNAGCIVYVQRPNMDAKK